VNKLNDLASIYGSFHQSKANQIMHMIGIPIIIASLLMMANWFTLSFLTHGAVELSWLLIVLVAIYYLQINAKTAIIMPVIYIGMNLIMIAICYPMTHKTQIIIAVALFVIGWILNFIGHAIEGKKPAFLHNLLQTLIAPIFITEEIAELFGFKIFNIQYNTNSADNDNKDKVKQETPED
jgi:uncharacterized membrane protein YGL010W